METVPSIAPARSGFDAAREPRETGGVTTRLILDYTEREGGRDAVDALLARSGCAGREEELRDENSWCSFETKIALLEAASEVLHDGQVARHIGEAGMDFKVGQGLKLSLRALGSLRLLYNNIVRTCAKFTSTHRMEAVELGPRHARVHYVDVTGAGYHPLDCQLNVGFLSCAPVIFGLPLARVSHPICARDGGGTCVYDIRWASGASRLRTTLAALLAGGASITAALALDPALLPEAGAFAALAAAEAGRREWTYRRGRVRGLEQRAEQQAEVAERLATSLQDLVSDLRTDEVLEKVTRNAQSAVGGKEFVLLVDEGDSMRCRSSSILARECVAALETWAGRCRGGAEIETVLDDLTLVPELAALPLDRALPLRSLCAAPLRYQGASLGVLVALANGEHSFLPHDVELLQSYASQAAIALANARLYEAQQALASRDPLTELFNHREFHEQLGRELERCRRHGGELSVVMLDVDDFKHVNDTGGHAEGDRVLIAVASALGGAIRGEDLAFRVGGDEFALLLPATGAREAIRVAERAGEAISELPGRVGISYGIGEWPSDGPSKETVLARADSSLYAMKRSATLPQRPAAQTPESEMERQRKRLSSASRLSARLAHLLDPAEIARATVDELHETFGYHLAVVQRLCDDGCLRPVAGAGALTREMDGFYEWAQPKERGVNGRAFRTGEPILVHDTRLDPDFLGTNAPRNAGSELALPIRVAGEIWGILNVEELGTHAFSSDDLVFADVMAAHVGAALDRNRLFGELENTFMTTLAVLSDALETKDAYTAAHARDVADLTDEVGAALGLDAESMRTLRYGALLHDIGKIAIPTEILTKPGKLTDEEFEVIKEHTVIGAKMLLRIPFFERVHPVVRSAHERWDGAGYPDGLAGTDIPLEARIVCACDAFHAMTSDRPYREAMPVSEAIAELRRSSGTHFDPDVVDALVGVASEHLSGGGQRG